MSWDSFLDYLKLLINFDGLIEIWSTVLLMVLLVFHGSSDIVWYFKGHLTMIEIAKVHGSQLAEKSHFASIDSLVLSYGNNWLLMIRVSLKWLLKDNGFVTGSMQRLFWTQPSDI